MNKLEFLIKTFLVIASFFFLISSNSLYADNLQWQDLSPEEQKKAKGRMKEWSKLPEDEKKQLKERYKRFKNLPPEKRKQLRKKYQWFKNQPPEKRDHLKKRWQDQQQNRQ